MKDMKSLPADWLKPEWNINNHPHNWHNYTTVDVRALWDTFSVLQKQVLASCFEETASNEEWD